MDVLKNAAQSASVELYVVSFAAAIGVAFLLWRTKTNTLTGAAAGSQANQPSGERVTQPKREGKKRRARAKKAAALNRSNETTTTTATTNPSATDETEMNQSDEKNEVEEQVLLQHTPVVLTDDPRLKAGNAEPVHIGGHTTDLWADNTIGEQPKAVASRPPANDGWCVVPTKTKTSKTKGPLKSAAALAQHDGDAEEERRKKKNRKKNEARKAKRDMLRAAQQD